MYTKFIEIIHVWFLWLIFSLASHLLFFTRHSLPGWPDWANFLPIRPMRLGLLFAKVMHLFWQKCIGLHLERIFHKLDRSPCLLHSHVNYITNNSIVIFFKCFNLTLPGNVLWFLQGGQMSSRSTQNVAKPIFCRRNFFCEKKQSNLFCLLLYI
jgi:cytochrome c oxidase subunit IV